jgi:hypothetical protein
MDEWREGKKSLLLSSFVLSAETIDLDETEHGSVVRLERGTISPTAPYNCLKSFRTTNGDERLGAVNNRLTGKELAST